MQSSSAAVNSANAASFSANSERKASFQSYNRTLRKCEARFIGLPSLYVCRSKDQDIKGLHSGGTLIVSPSLSKQQLLAAPLSEQQRTCSRSGSFTCNEYSDTSLRHQAAENLVHIIVEKLIVMKLMMTGNWLRHSEQLKSWYLQSWAGGRKGLVSLIAATICLTCPTIELTDISIGISDNIAHAQSIGQIRQAAVFLERIVGANTSTKVLDKVMTVISGQTVVTPETVEKLKSIIDGEKSAEDWQTDLANNAETFWSTGFDVVSHFDPISLIQATGDGIQGLIEGGAERFAAFELSSLVALGERWILWAPFVAIPMYWQMKRNTSEGKGVFGREKLQPALSETSEEAIAKAARVRDELERIELKDTLLDLVYCLGKRAWQSSGTDQNIERKQIDEILARLQELNPTRVADLGNALVKTTPADLGSALVNIPPIETTSIQPALDVDGEWTLIYASQTLNRGEQTQLPQFPNLNIPGIELGSLRQKLWRKASRLNLSTTDNETELIRAKNTTQVRLGPLGVVEISVQGSWENRRNGRSALVSFDTFSAKPIEVLGSLVREDFPPLDVPIPRTLQTSREWDTVYLDKYLRINRGRTGQLYLFKKSK